MNKRIGSWIAIAVVLAGMAGCSEGTIEGGPSSPSQEDQKGPTATKPSGGAADAGASDPDAGPPKKFEEQQGRPPPVGWKTP